MTRSIIENGQVDSFYAKNEAETKEFINDIIKVMEKHNLAIVPTHSDGDVSLHDGMRVIPLDEDVKKFIKSAGVLFKP